MGSINKCHNEANGGILLYQGELILLYSDSVDCQIGGKASVKGRLFLTTHRVVLIVAPFKPSAPVKSLCAPFCAITKIKLEQPIFGANYIEATVSDESDRTKSFTFKLKFFKGGACEFAMAMNRVVAAVGQQAQQANAPPSYAPSPTEQFYQAPPTVYAPGYNCGIQMPLNQFPDQPPIGFIYTSTAPPPYPGLPTSNPNPQMNPGQNIAGTQYPQQPQQQQPPQQQPQQYPQSSYPTASYPQASYPQASNPQTQNPQGSSYPQSSYPQSSYPQASYPQSSYSQQPAANQDAAAAPSAPPPPYA